MKPNSRAAAEKQPECIDFVPKRDMDRAQRENDHLRKENDRLRQEAERLQQEAERLQQETERLRRELEAALRASKRQAAPHSRGNPKAHPQRPGRKPGRRYGRQACRPIPSRVDERIAVPLPERFPHCGGGVQPESCETQYQEEIVRRTIVRRFDNRSWKGAWTQQVLVSVLRTCWQQGKDAFTRGVKLLRAPRGEILDIVPGAESHA